MNVVDLHPEELLDKDARGALTEDERGRLDAHLARCLACRAERLLRLDFADDLAGDVAPREPAIVAPREPALREPAARAPRSPRLALRSEERASEEHVAASKRDGVVARVKVRSRRTAVALVVAAAVLAAGAAAAATGVIPRAWLDLLRVPDEPSPALTEPAVALRSPRPSAAVAMDVPASAELAMPSDLATPSELAAASDLPASAELAMPSDLATPSELAAASDLAMPLDLAAPSDHAGPSLILALGPPPAVRARAPASASPFVSEAASASALFDAANASRRAGDATTAIARYDALGVRFPASPEARIAKATAAKLLLDRGEARGALTRFDAYLAAGAGPLREEAMAGRATALERLGRDEEEASAWAALLSTYPGTPYASHARLRVELHARP